MAFVSHSLCQCKYRRSKGEVLLLFLQEKGVYMVFACELAVWALTLACVWLLIEPKKLFRSCWNTVGIAFFPHKQIPSAAWDTLGCLAWLPLGTPEGSRRPSIVPVSCLLVPCGMVLLNVLGILNALCHAEKEHVLYMDPRIYYQFK